ncbi:uncharacterized protein F4812DRAFT_442865 [Daldinia caldariorum]|uniref:uncharacterized protein n=1 Tax=Daldinia caldariorum TaxID=326644 RepID=UPI002008E155|nr:uncharacterized protein F4812DRAFT_442865 [Daldinia caldariorum]KAI1464292.1 hypothetical protein F4812DRAFT_442865 [Daldinia caldariorum]
MPSNSDKFCLDLIQCCMPRPRNDMANPVEPNNNNNNNNSSSSYLRERYNAQVRQNLDRGQRPLQLPARVENNIPQPPPHAHTHTHYGHANPSYRFPVVGAGGAVSGGSGSGGGGSGEKDPRKNWSTSSLDKAELAGLFDTVAAALEHVRYAICGLAGLADHGFTGRAVTRVSILCAAHAKDVVKAWLAASGYEVYADSVGVPVPAAGSGVQNRSKYGYGGGGYGQRGSGGSGGKICRVRIKYLDEGFERLERVRSRVSEAWVLGLASQLDHAAAGYVDYSRKKDRREQQRQKLLGQKQSQDHNENQNQKGKEGNVSAGNKTKQEEEEKEEQENEEQKDEQALATIARDVFWVLDKAARTHHVLEPRLLPTLLSREFWEPFTRRHGAARPEMARAGIDVAAVLAQHRAEQALQEHDEMLRSYGVDPYSDVDSVDGGAPAAGKGGKAAGGGGRRIVAQQPGPFEGMHALHTGKTLYTPGQQDFLSPLPSPSHPHSHLPPPLTRTQSAAEPGTSPASRRSTVQ